jgi:hypothetical protein
MKGRKHQGDGKGPDYTVVTSHPAVDGQEVMLWVESG